MSGTFHTTRAVIPTGDARIDGVLQGRAWADPTLYYSVPDSHYEYGSVYGLGEQFGQFSATAAMGRVIDFALADHATAARGFSVEGFSALSVQYTTDPGAHIRLARTTLDPYGTGTAWGYYPTAHNSGGDVWFATRVADYSRPVAGDYAHLTIMHEIGHALGLFHGHEHNGNFGKLPHEWDTMEYSLMTYKSHVGAGTYFGYSNEAHGFAQSWMMLDIAALQHLYGADFTTNSGDTVYSWTPGAGDTLVDGAVAIDPGANRIFATIWDGGGIDTYDLSAYASDLAIDLAPGGHSVFSATQQARLGIGRDARGNIFNALLHKGDERSLIENAIGGSGNDTIRGNQADNLLQGKDGHDRLFALGGDDTLVGETGRDRLFGGHGRDALHGGGGRDRLLGGGGADTLKGGAGNDLLRGGAGKDILVGGGGADVFHFASARDSKGRTSDIIRDFKSGTDRIDLSDMVAGGFTLRLNGSFVDGAASVTTRKLSGDIILRADIDGDGGSDFRLVLSEVTQVTAEDFLL